MKVGQRGAIDHPDTRNSSMPGRKIWLDQWDAQTLKQAGAILSVGGNNTSSKNELK
jgi:hypothetical protein